MATFMNTDCVKYVSNGAIAPLCELAFCRHCLELRSKLCVFHEVSLVISFAMLSGYSDIGYLRLYLLYYYTLFVVTYINILKVDSLYCPNCLENMPAAEAKARKNRFVESQWQTHKVVVE